MDLHVATGFFSFRSCKVKLLFKYWEDDEGYSLMDLLEEQDLERIRLEFKW